MILPTTERKEIWMRVYAAGTDSGICRRKCIVADLVNLAEIQGEKNVFRTELSKLVSILGKLERYGYLRLNGAPALNCPRFRRGIDAAGCAGDMWWCIRDHLPGLGRGVRARQQYALKRLENAAFCYAASPNRISILRRTGGQCVPSLKPGRKLCTGALRAGFADPPECARDRM